MPLLVALVGSLLVSPAAAQDQTESTAHVAGAELWLESDCTGDVPIVVGSDAKAQSDIYSAVTLAGVVGTDCVVLAGARDAAMPEAQAARLAAAADGGYVVGGEAAVPPAKLGNREMTRISGTNRWATAQRVGDQAVRLAGGTPAEAPAAQAAPLPDDVSAPGLHLSGAEPWVASDCAGDVPIVVGSDAKAQSDIYSAVTLAGVVGTDCVVLAGARDADMPQSQAARLAAAADGGYVVGGAAAVPAAKVTGRDGMVRLAGRSRWRTAQKVGDQARSLTGGSVYTAVTAGVDYSCGLRVDGTLTCWGNNADGQSDAPPGRFASVDAGSWHACAVRVDGTLTCWGYNGSNRRTEAPAGTFSAVSAGRFGSCALRAADGAAVCWGDDDFADPPSGTFSVVSVGRYDACAVRVTGKAVCWGSEYGRDTMAELTDGFSREVEVVDVEVSIGAQTVIVEYDYLGNLFIATFGWNREGQRAVPHGRLSGVSLGDRHGCGLEEDGSVVCWGATQPDSQGNRTDYGQTNAPSGKFVSVTAGARHSCALQADGTLTCWGDVLGTSPPS